MLWTSISFSCFRRRSCLVIKYKNLWKRILSKRNAKAFIFQDLRHRHPEEYVTVIDWQIWRRQFKWKIRLFIHFFPLSFGFLFFFLLFYYQVLNVHDRNGVYFSAMLFCSYITDTSYSLKMEVIWRFFFWIKDFLVWEGGKSSYLIFSHICKFNANF